MKVPVWIQRIEPYFGDVPPEIIASIEEEQRLRGEFRSLKHLESGENRWRLRVVLEPDYRITHYWVSAYRVDHDPEPLLVFNANEIGWTYDVDDPLPVTCACGHAQFALWIVFQETEDAAGEHEWGWFWLFADCS